MIKFDRLFKIEKLCGNRFLIIKGHHHPGNDFSKKVDKLIVIEELDPFLQENIQAMGIKVIGKEFIPLVGELNPDIIEKASRKVESHLLRFFGSEHEKPEHLVVRTEEYIF